MSLNGLLAEVKAHPEVWNMYEKGYVIGLNQVEKPSTQRKVMKYKPKNISELSAFIAGIRPAFKSLLDKLINREHFEYGIPTLDKLLQTEELPESFILYQEQIMKILSFAGIPMGDCYTVIKSISKKRFEKIMHYKEQFMTGMEHKLIEEEGISKERAEETAKTIWGIIEDASAYGFNSSHSLSVSFDSLLAAYFKALYPYEFYEVYLNLQMERADKAKALLAKKEMKEAFDISVLPMRFRQDNRKFVALPEQKALSNCLKSIKGFGDRIGEEFYKIKDTRYEDFIDFLVDIDIMKKNKEDSENYNPDIPSGFAVNGSQIEILIMLNYFEEFGKNYKLLKVFKLYNDFSSRKQINKKDINMETGVLKSGKDTYYLDITVFKKYIGKETKSMYKDLDMIGYVKEMASKIPDKSVDLLEQLKFERELLEFPIYQNPSLPKGWYYVIGFKTYGDKINTPYLVLYDLITSDLVVCSINKSKLFRDNPFGFYSIIHVKSFQDVVKKKKVGEKKFVPTNETKKVIADYEVVLRNEKEELEVLEQQMEEQKSKKEG
jgi:DNA polymerase III alpha subunit